MSAETDLARYLKRSGHESAATEVLRIFTVLECVTKSLHALPAKSQKEKADHDILVESLERAVKATKRIEGRLPAKRGLSRSTPEQRWGQSLAAMLVEVQANAPRVGPGRPRNIGEEKQALAVMHALLRHGVPERTIVKVTTECLSYLGMVDASIDRAVRAASAIRRKTKPPVK